MHMQPPATNPVKRSLCCYAELVRQVIAAGEAEGLQVLAENALEGGIYNADALNRMLKNSKHFQRCATQLSPLVNEYDIFTSFLVFVWKSEGDVVKC